MSELDERKIIRNEYIHAVEMELTFVDPEIAEAARAMGQRNYPQGLATHMQLNAILRKLNESIQVLTKRLEESQNSSTGENRSK